MKYCPNCEKAYPDKDAFCPDCGNSLDDEAQTGAANEQPGQTEDAGTAAAGAGPASTAGGGGAAGGGPGSWFYQNRVWIILGAAVVVIAITVGVLLLLRGGSDPVATTPTSTSTTPTATTDTAVKAYQDNLTRSWNTLRDITVELIKKDKEVVDQPSLNTFNALLTLSYDKIEQVRNEMGKMQVPADQKKRHDSLIDGVGSYRDYIKSLLNVTSVDPSKTVSADFEPVSTAGEDAQKKIVASEKQLPFLRALPEECFMLHTMLNTFYTAIWQAPMPQATRTPTPAPAPAGSEQDAILAMVRGDSAGSWAGADNIEVVSYDPTTNSAIVLVTYYLTNVIRYSELYCDKDQYGWYVSYENTYEVPY